MFQRHLWRHAVNQKYKTTINTCGLSFTMFLPSFVPFGIFRNHLCVSNEPCGRKTPISDHRVKPSCMHFLLKRSEGSIKGHLGSFTFSFWARCPGYHSSSYHKRHLVTNQDVYIFGFLSLLYTIICRNASTVKCLFFGTKTQRAAIRSNSLYYYALGSEISYKTHL